MLPNLNELISPIIEKIRRFKILDCPLPESFTSQVKTINNDIVEYGKSSSCITNRKGQHIFLSNNWFYIAAILSPLNGPFNLYKDLLNRIVDKEALKKSDENAIRLAINTYNIDQQDKEYLLKFALDPSWWNGGTSNTGGKSLDRGDALVSAVLSIANLINASQSYVATLWFYLGAHPEYANILNEAANKLINDIELSEYKKRSTLQEIFFGSPGTGKSFHIKNEILSDVKEEFIFRTTFHPDSDYASFVGTYKPVSKIVGRKHMDYEAICSAFKNFKGTTDRPFYKFVAEHHEDIEAIGKLQFKEMFLDTEITEDTYNTEYSKAVSIAKYLNKIKKDNTTISYEFEPQVFTEAYIKAWQYPNEQIYLVIEEINRGNCAQIFGDLFQLLDRKNGVSEYPVKADAALAKYLIKELRGRASEGIKNGKLKLPANLNIIATMNTSDQSLFPMDSAFKRRWEWKYIPTIAPTDKERKLDLNFKESKEGGDKQTIDAGNYSYSWKRFLNAINIRITKATHSDDKQLGFWFVKAENEEDNISVSTFVSKVIFYLWNDIFKDFGPKDTNPFTVDINGRKEIMPFSSFFEINSDGQIVENIGVLHTFMQNLKIEPEIKKEIIEVQDIQEQGDNPDE